MTNIALAIRMPLVFSLALCCSGCIRDSSQSKPEVSVVGAISVGDDVAQARQVLAKFKADDWTSSCGLPMITGPVFRRYYHTADGFNISVVAEVWWPPEPKRDIYRVLGIWVDDSTANRSAQEEWSCYGVASLTFDTAGRTRLAGLPNAVLHQYMPEAEARQRLRAYSLERVSFEPFKPNPWQGRQDSEPNAPLDITPKDGWECYSFDGLRLYLRFQDRELSNVVCLPVLLPKEKGGDLVWSRRFREAKYIPYQVFDLNWLTLANYRKIVAKALPAGWAIDPQNMSQYYVSILQGNGGPRVFDIRFLPRMPDAEAKAMQEARPARQARLEVLNQSMEVLEGFYHPGILPSLLGGFRGVEVEEEVDAEAIVLGPRQPFGPYTPSGSVPRPKGLSVSVIDPQDRQLFDEIHMLEELLSQTPDLQTDDAAIVVDFCKPADSNSRKVVDAILSTLKSGK